MFLRLLMMVWTLLCAAGVTGLRFARERLAGAARAMVHGSESVNRLPPGDETGVRALPAADSQSTSMTTHPIDRNDEPLHSEFQTEQLREVLESFHHALVESLEQCTSLSEGSIGETGIHLGTIVQDAKALDVRMQALLERVHDTNSGYATATGTLERLTLNYLSDFQEQVSLQARAAEESIRQCAAISYAEEMLSRIVFSSSHLVIYAQIVGVEFDSEEMDMERIVEQLQGLNQKAGHATALISGLRGQLLTVLNQIKKHTTLTLSMTERFAAEIRKYSCDVEGQNGQLRQTLVTFLEDAEASMQLILTHSRDALSHLQYQDPMMQELHQLDVALADDRTVIASLLGHSEQIAPLQYMAKLGHLTGGQKSDEAGMVEVGEALFF